MTFPGEYEVPSVRLMRLRSALASTAQSMGDTVSDAVDLEARRRAMEDNLRRFREVERRRPSPFSRIPDSARPTPEQRRERQGRVFPDPALRGTDVGDRQQRQLDLYQLLIAQGVDPGEAEQRAFSGSATFTRGETVTPEGQLALTRGEDLQPGQLTPPGTVSDVVGQPPAAITGVEQFRTRFTAPISAAALQVAESPAGAGIPGIRGLREIQAAAGPAGRALGGADIGVPGVGEAVEVAGAIVGAAEATLPRQRTFGEVFEGGAVNPLAAALGSEEEQRKAQAVLEEAGLARSLAFELVFDPFNLVPVIGFTKVDDFLRLLRAAISAPGRGRQAAITALRNSETVQAALRGVREAGEAGFVRPSGPLRGGELPGGSIAETSDEAVTHIAKADPGPPPKEPPGAPPREPPRGPTPDDPEFDDILDAAIKGEKPDQALMRRHQGVIDARASQFAVEVTDNNKELVRIGLGQHFRGSVVAKTEGSFDELNSLLHNPGAVARGERIVPDELRSIYDKLRAQTDWEQAARVDFDPNQALVEDYFFRG
ncbi:hypothetical protein LCGC14_2002010, partial [marine sediment metagenome]